MAKARRGVYAAALSPFGPSGGLDAPKLIEYCQFLLGEGGCDGVAPTGTTGEGTSIAARDRLALPSAFAGAGVAPDRVILGAGAPSADDALALTRAAVDQGYVNVLLLPPYFYKGVGDEGLFAYFARIIEGVRDDALRAFLYHFPQMSQTPLSPSLVRRLRAAFGPMVAGLKDSSGDFEQSRAFVDATGGVEEDFDVYPSNEAFAPDALAIGCAGVISGSTNAFAPGVQAALTAPDAERDAAWARVGAARALASKRPLIASMKHIQALRSGDDGWLRFAPPLTPLDADQAAALRADLDAFEA